MTPGAADKSRTLLWMAGACLASLAIGGMTLWTVGVGPHGTLTGLQLTARWSYFFFLPAYTGGALATVFGSAFRPLALKVRDLGLAFASAHVTHLCLVAWDYHILPHPPIPLNAAIYFGVAALFTYLLALFSFPALAAKLHPTAWWALRTFGMDFIAVAFLRDFMHDPLYGSLAHVLGYWPFIALGVAAAALRIAAYAKKLRRWWLAPQPAG